MLILKYKIEFEIRAILFGVNENIVGKLNLGNKYHIRKENIINNNYYRLFGYNNSSMFNTYYSASIDDDDSSEVAVLYKKFSFISPKIKDIPGKGCYMNGKEYTEYLNDIELKEYCYLYNKMRLIRFYSDNSFNIKEVFIIITIYDNKKIVLPTIYSRYPFNEKISDSQGKLSLSNNIEANRLNRFINNFDFNKIKRCYEKDLLTNAFYLYDQTYSAPTVSLRFMVGVIAIESLMIDKNDKGDLTYRFYRNTSMLLSKNIFEYNEYKSKLKNIYNYRSRYVHNGFVEDIDQELVKDVRDILREILKKIIKLNISKKELLLKLEIKGIK